MFDFDSLREVGSTINKNKMRTALTGVAVAWGILLLVVLLGAGAGLQHGMEAGFSRRAMNSVTIWPGTTSMPYKGMPSNRNITFNNKDYELIRKLPEVQYVSATIWKSGTINYGEEYGAWTMQGVSHEANHIHNLEINSGNGRFLNKVDMDARRKVIVISEEMKRVLFKDLDPLGKYVLADGIAFQVVGIYSTMNEQNNPPSYIPFTTAQMLYSGGYGFGRMEFTINGVHGEAANRKFIEKLRTQLGQLHTFDPDDRSALGIWNTAERAEQANNAFIGIRLFIWIIGLASLMAGIVGVGNIMLITVKERTKEFGIRKALGAKPNSILTLVIWEAILITSVGGYLGIVLGVGFLELVNLFLDSLPAESMVHRMFISPSVDVGVAVQATVVLIIAGVSAGLLPAIKATKISPIEAMRAD